MMPITAIPPATDIPMIEPVLRPEELSLGEGVEVGEEAADEDWPPVTVVVTTTPLLVVSWIGPTGVGEKTGDWLVIGLAVGVVLVVVLVCCWVVVEGGVDVVVSVWEVDWSTVDAVVVVGGTAGNVAVVVGGFWALSWRERKRRKREEKKVDFISVVNQKRTSNSHQLFVLTVAVHRRPGPLSFFNAMEIAFGKRKNSSQQMQECTIRNQIHMSFFT
jgi:hypothetical protein